MLCCCCFSLASVRVVRTVMGRGWLSDDENDISLSYLLFSFVVLSYLIQ